MTREAIAPLSDDLIFKLRLIDPASALPQLGRDPTLLTTAFKENIALA
jgi:hypothetical protein